MIRLWPHLHYRRCDKSSIGLGLLLILILLNTQPVYGDNPDTITSIDIVTPQWINQTNKDGTGVYFELLRMVYEPHGINVTYKFAPWPRAVRYVDSKKSDAMLGSYNTVDAFFPDFPLDTEYTAVVYKKESVKKWAGLKTIENQNVIWVRGYNYHKYLSVKVKYQEVTESRQGWNMLMNDRTVFFMDALGDLRKYAAQNSIDLTRYQIKTVLTKNLYVRFAKTEKSKKLIEIYDHRMRKLVDSGEIKKLYEKWDFRYPLFD